jgi:hypothetical protein
MRKIGERKERRGREKETGERQGEGRAESVKGKGRTGEEAEFPPHPPPAVLVSTFTAFRR